MKIVNKRAKFNYKLYEEYEVGISLTGAEVKSIKRGNIDLSHSFVKIIGDQAYLINANIPVEEKGGKPTRTRKLLLHKKEIISIKTKIKAKGLILVPVKMYNRGNLIKIKIALAKSKRKFEKRGAIKKRDIEREIEKEFKNSV